MGPWRNLVENIAGKLAFFPPTPASYTLQRHKDGSNELYIQPTDKAYPKVVSGAHIARLTTQRRREGGGGHEIVAAFLPYTSRGKRARATILYSHGNAVDLGQMMPVLRDLSRILKVSVVGYDFSGYGVCGGTPSVSNTFADISAVYELLQKEHGVAPQDVVLYGQSVGSGPTTWLAAQPEGAAVAGVVLHAPLLSGVRVLNPSLRFWPALADVYPNHLLVRHVRAPLLVMHGTADEVIHVSCGKRLVELAPTAVEPLWADGYGHQNLEASPEYIPRLRAFLAQLFPNDYQRAQPQAVQQRQQQQQTSASNRPAQIAASRRLVVAVDMTQGAFEAVAWVCDHLARSGDTLHLLHVVPRCGSIKPQAGFSLAHMMPSEDGLTEHVAAHAQAYIGDTFMALAEERGVSSMVDLVYAGCNQRVSDAICARAEELSAAVVVLASHKRGLLEGIFSESVSRQVVANCRQPILILQNQ